MSTTKLDKNLFLVSYKGADFLLTLVGGEWHVRHRGTRKIINVFSAKEYTLQGVVDWIEYWF